jgi:hypothetical protein
MEDSTSIDCAQCGQCPTSFFLTCKSKVYPAYESEALLRATILECSGKAWYQHESKDPTIMCKRYTKQDEKNTLKYEQGTGIFVRWMTLASYYVPH